MMEYHEEEEKRTLTKLRRVINELPDFCREFFVSMDSESSTKTRLGYAYDLRVFFNYLIEENPKFEGKTMKDFTITDLDSIDIVDINEYMQYLSLYVKNKDGKDVEVTNRNKGKARKLSSVRRLLGYFYKVQKIGDNPAELATTPKIPEKEIIRLEPDEAARLLDTVESGDKLTERQKKYHDITALRDKALITLLLGTGMRVSECVGIDIGDIDFNVNGIRIIRKGGKEVVIYFGEEVEKALKDYIAERTKEENESKIDPNALFLSIQKKRIGVRAVQNLVKKYTDTLATNKRLSPHKLRSTYGTELYRATGDIYLVADVLGHSDVNTTKKHYASQSEDNRKLAARYVKIRE
jgi:site-specific recombinase XerD